MANFIFMLTHNDRTVPNALDVLEELQGTGLVHIGLKDAGVTPDELKEITKRAQSLGLVVHLEVVAHSVEEELASVRAGVDAGVDWIVGGQNAEKALEVIAGSEVKFAPFPGRVSGPPLRLNGSIEEIAAHTAQLTALDRVDGVDLVAYRHVSADPEQLVRAVVEAAGSKPVIVAGSVSTPEQIQLLARAGVWGFTIGGAIFEGTLPGEKDVASQVRTVLQLAA